VKPPPSPAVEALKKASKGLRMPSETDAPFRAFQWDDAGDLTHDRLLALAHQPKDTAVEETDLATLFQTVPKASRPKFQALQQALQQQLSGVKVYQLGDEAERQVYIVGKTKDGHWAGLRTTVVET
jgi:hypothetical protein